jgi:hypothetical protein
LRRAEFDKLQQQMEERNMNPMLTRKTLIVSSVALALGAPSAQAALDVLGPYSWSTDSANFTLLNSAGGAAPSGYNTNNVNMVWDGDAYSASSDYTGPGGAANMMVSSTSPFFSATWMAHDAQIFLPGTYSFDTALGGGNLEAGILSVTVGAGQLGMHMLWDWSGNLNIDTFMVFAQDSVFGGGIGRSTTATTSGGNNCDGNGTALIKNCLYDGKVYGSAGKPAGNTVWMLASVDGNGDGIMGVPMTPDGPWNGFSWNFNANLTAIPDPVPVPAAAWLFGSGLLGLFGVAYRRKKTT